MKISIVTVCYNAASTIESALSSVASQTYPHKEHIVIDGGSKDATAEILRARRSRLAHLISEPDEGIYDAMNKGIALASGEIIGLLNADDAYAHDRVLEQVARVMRQENLDALYGDVDYVRPGTLTKVVRRYSSARFSPQRIAWGWMPAHPALFLRREVYKAYGPFRTDYKIAADFEYVARIFSSGRLRYRYLPEVLVRMRTGGVSTAGWRNTLLLNKEVLRACRENHIPTSMAKILSKYPAKLLELIFP